MEKKLLEDYMDARALVKETEQRIERLKERKTVLHDKVSGSMHEFPYAPTSFKVEGTPRAEMEIIAQEERLLYLQKADAMECQLAIAKRLENAPMRLRRIISLRYEDNLSWEEVADRVRAISGEAARKEFERMLRDI